MNLLQLTSLLPEQLPAVVALDQRCFGGLWSLEGYKRELESPNSELLVINGGVTNSKQLEELEIKFDVSEIDVSRTGHKLGIPTALDKTPSQQAPFQPLLALGCFWAILDEAHITILAVDPDWRHRGLGQILLWALLSRARQRHMARATLEVRISNQAALNLYDKFGFRIAGRRRGYYQDNGEDALILWQGELQHPAFSQRLWQLQHQAQKRLQHLGEQLSITHDGLSQSISFLI
ncbi:MAG: ribosomal protein S18-alanine N-acetyltransferase [Cyanothece sp. SIO1E1]|nr:ribosomal protein S18-alanine N-acetyltransferase [Cyanothece sp. SIO1E1]